MTKGTTAGGDLGVYIDLLEASNPLVRRYAISGLRAVVDLDSLSEEDALSVFEGLSGSLKDPNIFVRSIGCRTLADIAPKCPPTASRQLLLSLTPIFSGDEPELLLPSIQAVGSLLSTQTALVRTMGSMIHRLVDLLFHQDAEVRLATLRAISEISHADGVDLAASADEMVRALMGGLLDMEEAPGLVTTLCSSNESLRAALWSAVTQSTDSDDLCQIRRVVDLIRLTRGNDEEGEEELIKVGIATPFKEVLNHITEVLRSMTRDRDLEHYSDEGRYSLLHTAFYSNDPNRRSRGAHLIAAIFRDRPVSEEVIKRFIRVVNERRNISTVLPALATIASGNVDIRTELRLSLREVMVSGDDDEEAASARVFGRFELEDTDVDILRDRVERGGPKTAMAAARALEDLDPERAVRVIDPLLQRALDGGGSGWVFAEVTGRMLSRGAVLTRDQTDTIVTSLKGKDPGNAVWLCRFLELDGKGGMTKALDAMMALLGKKGDPQIRKTVIETLLDLSERRDDRGLQNRVIPRVIGALDDEHPLVRQTAASGLQTRFDRHGDHR